MVVYLATAQLPKTTKGNLLYICIPAYNEAPTIGVLLWRIRKVFQGYSREYEILIYDDGSTDGTSETVAPYSEVAPVTIIRGESRRGYAHALDTLAREASRRTKYPRRDAMIVMQADFTDQPEHLPELARRFEGGVDIVIAERTAVAEPPAVARLRKLAPWAVRFSIGFGSIDDPFATYRLYRISLVRELIKASGDKPIVTTAGWGANAELLLATVPLARRVERLSLDSRYDLRVRESRIKPVPDAIALYRFGRAFKGRRIAPPVHQPTADATTGQQSSKPRERASS